MAPLKMLDGMPLVRARLSRLAANEKADPVRVGVIVGALVALAMAVLGG